MFQDCCTNDWFCPAKETKKGFGDVETPWASPLESIQKPETAQTAAKSKNSGLLLDSTMAASPQSLKMSMQNRGSVPLTLKTAASAVKIDTVESLNAQIENKRRSCSVLKFTYKNKQNQYGTLLSVNKLKFKKLTTQFNNHLQKLDNIQKFLQNWVRNKQSRTTLRTHCGSAIRPFNPTTKI